VNWVGVVLRWCRGGSGWDGIECLSLARGWFWKKFVLCTGLFSFLFGVEL
jgi:hypothetical protein